MSENLTEKKNVMVYTEATPNPETLKFVTSQILLERGAAEITNLEEAKGSPLAEALLAKEHVSAVFITHNFVTVTRSGQVLWAELIPDIRTFIKSWLEEEKTIFTEEKIKSLVEIPEGGDDIETRIINLLDKYVRPAVEMDGGAIVFKSFDKGKVNLQLQGACSGCPSSMITLKAGIEGMMKRMIPEVTEVVAEEG